MNKKNLLFNGLLLVLFSFLYSCSGIEANVDITLPKGPKGDSGLSAYEVWKESVNNGVVNWPKNEVDVNDFFRYLKGKDGKDGKDGKSAYEQWKESISTGNVEDPHNPGQKWDSNKNTVKDFWMFLAGKDGKNGLDGKDGKNGLSAYELWAKDLADKCGTADQLMDPHNPSQPWPCDKNSMQDFWQYLRGVDGQSAYALWKQKVNDGTIDWPKNEVSESDFFRYLKGKDGKDGKDGADGRDGERGYNAYEVWYQFISSGNVPNPHKPGEKWDPNKNTMQDFWVFLTGAKGENGKNAYELWKEELESRCGTTNPMMNPHNPTMKWDCQENSMEDYLRYIRGVDGASAYQVWKDAVEKGTITWAGSKDTDGFFLYLKGEKGEKGDPGKNGATAYEVWKEFIKNGDVPNPHNPTEFWDKNHNSEVAFWQFLAGPKGEKGDNGTNGTNGTNGVNGKSAYELWKEQVVTNCDNPAKRVMNPHDPAKPWPCNKVTQDDFWDYLRGPRGSDGKDGKDGEPGQAVEVGRPNVLPVFYNGKLREYVNPADGSVEYQVFDKNGNKVAAGVKVKGIPGLTDQNVEFTTDEHGKIKVSREYLPVNLPAGSRAGSAKVNIDNAGFVDTAPNTLTPNKIHTRLVMDFAYLRQWAPSSWGREHVNSFTVALYRYEREVNGAWELYPEELPEPDVVAVKVTDHTRTVDQSNITDGGIWGKASLETYGDSFKEKKRGTHLFIRPMVLTPSEKVGFAANVDNGFTSSMKKQSELSKLYQWNNQDLYMSLKGQMNFYGETPIMPAAIHVPEIYPVPMVKKNNLKIQITTGKTSLWGQLDVEDASLHPYYQKYDTPTSSGVWKAIKKEGNTLKTLNIETYAGIAMTKNIDGTSGSTSSSILPFKYVKKSNFILTDSYPDNKVGFYCYFWDPKGKVSLGAEDERVLHNYFVPYRDGMFYELKLDGSLENPSNIRLIDVYDTSKVTPITKQNIENDWVIK